MFHKKALKALSMIINVLNHLASFLIIFIACWIFVDISGRLFFNHPIVGTPEIAANMIAAIAFLQLPKVLQEGRHIRSELILGRWKQAYLIEILSCLLGVVFFSLAIASNWEPTIAAWVNGEYEGEGALRVPSFPTRVVIMIGSILMAIQFAVNLIANIYKLPRRRCN